MMTAAFGEESATGSSLLMSQVSGDIAESNRISNAPGVVITQGDPTPQQQAFRLDELDTQTAFALALRSECARTAVKYFASERHDQGRNIDSPEHLSWPRFKSEGLNSWTTFTPMRLVGAAQDSRQDLPLQRRSSSGVHERARPGGGSDDAPILWTHQSRASEEGNHTETSPVDAWLSSTSSVAGELSMVDPGGVAGVGEGADPVPTIPDSDSARRDWNLTVTKPTRSIATNGFGVSQADVGGARNDGGGGVGGGVDDANPWVGLMPPRWVPDEETACCAGCGKDFDWARRRHHCRACGRLYCYSCSRFRALLPRSFGTRDPQRLCQPCNARVAPLQDMLIEHGCEDLIVVSEGGGQGAEVWGSKSGRGCKWSLSAWHGTRSGSVSNAVKENDLARGGLASYLNRPIAFTLGAEVRKAAYTIHNFTKEGMIQDRSIPQELLSRARGLAFLTVIKGGFIVAGRVGTGLVIAKTEDGMWSAPSAIATVGMGWGALIGGEITDFVLVLNTDSTVEAFSGRGQVSIGAELSVAVGPIGRTGAGNVSVAAEGLAHAYSYSHSRGLFAGLSLEGGVIIARPDVNRKFYGRKVSVRELLNGNVAPPPAARPLYEALEQRGSRAEGQRLISQSFRVG